jgi:hypothetical protein
MWPGAAPLATLLHRMVDDFLAYTAEEEHEQPAP